MMIVQTVVKQPRGTESNGSPSMDHPNSDRDLHRDKLKPIKKHNTSLNVIVPVIQSQNGKPPKNMVIAPIDNPTRMLERYGEDPSTNNDDSQVNSYSDDEGQLSSIVMVPVVSTAEFQPKSRG